MPTTTRLRENLAADDLHIIGEEEPDEDAEFREGGTVAPLTVERAPRRNGSTPSGHDDGLLGPVPFCVPYKGVARFRVADGTIRWRDERSGKVYREIVDALAMPDILYNDLWGSPYPGFPI